MRSRSRPWAGHRSQARFAQGKRPKDPLLVASVKVAHLQDDTGASAPESATASRDCCSNLAARLTIALLTAEFGQRVTIGWPSRAARVGVSPPKGIDPT